MSSSWDCSAAFSGLSRSDSSAVAPVPPKRAATSGSSSYVLPVMPASSVHSTSPSAVQIFMWAMDPSAIRARMRRSRGAMASGRPARTPSSTSGATTELAKATLRTSASWRDRDSARGWDNNSVPEATTRSTATLQTTNRVTALRTTVDRPGASGPRLALPEARSDLIVEPDQLAPQSDHDRLELAVRVELDEDVLDVAAAGEHRDAEGTGDGRGVPPLGEQGEDLLLPRGQQLRGALSAGPVADERPQQHRVHGEGPATGLAHRLDQLGEWAALGQQRRGSGLGGAGQQRVGHVGGEDDNAHLRVGVRDAAGQLDAVTVVEVHVHDDRVGPRTVDDRERVDDAARGADTLHVRLGGHGERQGVGDSSVVVDDQHTHHLGRHRAPSSSGQCAPRRTRSANQYHGWRPRVRRNGPRKVGVGAPAAGWSGVIRRRPPWEEFCKGGSG